MLKAPFFPEIMMEMLKNKNVNIFMEELFAFCRTTPTNDIILKH